MANLKENMVFSMRGKVEESVQDKYRDRKIIVYIFPCLNVMIIIILTFCLFMFIYIMVIFGD